METECYSRQANGSIRTSSLNIVAHFVFLVATLTCQEVAVHRQHGRVHRHEWNTIALWSLSYMDCWRIPGTKRLMHKTKRINKYMQIGRSMLHTTYLFVKTYDCIQDRVQSRKRLASLVATSHPMDKKSIYFSCISTLPVQFREQMPEIVARWAVPYTMTCIMGAHTCQVRSRWLRDSCIWFALSLICGLLFQV